METVASYFAKFPEASQKRMQQIRALILEKAPEVQESISYGMPAYKTNGKPLIYYAAFKNHIGLYATPSGHTHFAAALSSYKQGKGSVQFPNDQPFPLDLIAEIIAFRVEENKK
ncbi:iron chaperone [Flavobacterium sp. RSSA_27]|uniref:iron chaperone n=1 Tax=Flavobacterium sp. RSSA_27 TaxID=3447667 RepID=UPI003F337691